MLLKKLIISGFKSFCDRQEINFDKGISAIVGPNGCGKSNTVDSIKWVLGEQKTRMLRANSMTDVIFKGTEERRGLGRAEVKLVFINDDNALPVDFNEVEISRVIYASGENEYYINKEKVRLKDINELFFDTGIGKSAYSFMEQGKIDLILSTKAEDRRYIIEEAAGITKYKAKKDESLNRLKHADENILRVQDILKEVKGQYEHMSKQAEKAIKYKELYDKEMDMEIELNLNRVLRQKSIRGDFKERLAKTEEVLEEVKDKMSNLENTVADKMIYLNELENDKIDSQREVFQVESEIKVANSKTGMLKDQLVKLESALKADEDKIAAAERKLEEVEEEIEEIDEERYEISERISGIRKDMEKHEESIASTNDEIKSFDEKIKGLKADIKSAGDDLEEQRNELKQVTDGLVVKINESLNVLDVDSKEIMDLKTGISSEIRAIIDELKMRRGFIDDTVSTGYVSAKGDELLKRLSDFRDSLKGVEEKLGTTEQNVEKYIKATEIFMDDIFSPEGVLQQKRAVESMISEISARVKRYNESIDEYEDEIEIKKDKRERSKELLSEFKVNLSTMQEKQKSIDKDMERAHSMKEHYEANKNELTFKRKKTEEQMEDIRDDLDDIDYNLNKLLKKKKEIEAHLKDLDEKIQAENAKMTKQQTDIKEINDRWINKKTELERLTMKIEEADALIKNIYDTFYENFSINLNEYEDRDQYKSDRSYEEVRAELSGLRKSKSSLGNVNLMAIEESKVLEERYNLLNDQLNDLEEAKNDLLKVIDELNTISEELFIKTFNQIKVNFHKLFRKLFDGGNAEIKLTKPDNILETGIEIIAHPPGQKTQSITLLSGGQRTMTAISLMFATFLVKPSPFCLLDEIDAALDEENVTRFVNLLQEFRGKSQFIMITHNKKTISAADVMYGVTQESKGVSKIVAVKFKNQTEVDILNDNDGTNGTDGTDEDSDDSGVNEGEDSAENAAEPVVLE